VNQLAIREGVLEVPLLAYGEDLPLTRRVRFLDQESAIGSEQLYLLERAAGVGVGVVPLIMHSFSFCDPEVACPVEKHIERFDALLGNIARRPELFQVMTMPEFWEAYQRDPQAYLKAPRAMPTVTYWMVFRRSVERLDQGWLNVAFVVANVAAVVMFLVGMAWTVRRFQRGSKA
jgi:hypothetical protein